MALVGISPRAQPLAVQDIDPARQAPLWITRSNENAQVLLRVLATYAPEGAARQGVISLDEQVTQLPSDGLVRLRRDMQGGLSELRRRLRREADPLVAQDLRILIKAAEGQLEAQRLAEKYEIPYLNVPQVIFSGIQSLLDDQMPQTRYQAALVRLRKDVGLEPGYEPLTEQAKARSREWRQAGQIGPLKTEVEANLARTELLVNGIGDLFAQYRVDGYEEPLARLKQQIGSTTRG